MSEVDAAMRFDRPVGGFDVWEAALTGAGLMLALAACDSAKPPQYAPAPTEERTFDSPPPTPTVEATTSSPPPKREAVPDPDSQIAEVPERPIGQDDIRILVKALPLSLQAVRFQAIDDFLLLYAPFARNRAMITGSVRSTEKLMKQVTNATSNGNTIFQLGVNQQAVASMFPDNKIPAAFGRTLAQIVDNTRQVILEFYSQCGDQMSSDQREDIFAQIGERPGENSIYSKNIEYIGLYTSIPATPL
jgi:hypothetical protein